MRPEIARRIPRREVLAFIALTTDEASAPHEIEFREYKYNGKTWRTIDLAVDTAAAVRFWARVFGHGEHHFHEHQLTGGSMHSSSRDEGWRGFITRVEAVVPQPSDVPDVPLDDATTAVLRDLAVVTP